MTEPSPISPSLWDIARPVWVSDSVFEFELEQNEDRVILRSRWRNRKHSFVSEWTKRQKYDKLIMISWFFPWHFFSGSESHCSMNRLAANQITQFPLTIDLFLCIIITFFDSQRHDSKWMLLLLCVCWMLNEQLFANRLFAITTLKGQCCVSVNFPLSSASYVGAAERSEHSTLT